MQRSRTRTHAHTHAHSIFSSSSPSLGKRMYVRVSRSLLLIYLSIANRFEFRNVRNAFVHTRSLSITETNTCTFNPFIDRLCSVVVSTIRWYFFFTNYPPVTIIWKFVSNCDKPASLPFVCYRLLFLLISSDFETLCTIDFLMLFIWFWLFFLVFCTEITRFFLNRRPAICH